MEAIVILVCDANGPGEYGTLVDQNETSGAMVMFTTLYDDLVAAGCHTDAHESDLYVELTETAQQIIKRHEAQETLTTSTFINQIDGIGL
jgi:hypothetical protein